VILGVGVMLVVSRRFVVNDRLADGGECLVDDSVGTGTGGGDSRVWCGNRVIVGRYEVARARKRESESIATSAGRGSLSQAPEPQMLY
jgi:hypothetical protein